MGRPGDEARREILENIRELNLFISQNQLFVEAAVMDLANAYIDAGISLAKKLSEPRYHHIWLSWHDTRLLVPLEKLPPDEKELTLLFYRFRDTRTQLVNALKKPFA